MKKFKKYNLLYILIILSITFSSCMKYEDYTENHGNPSYKITLLNANGDVLDVKYAHEKYESCDWGMHTNYKFRYWDWNYYKNSTKWGDTHLKQWEWNKDRVIIERGNYVLKKK